MHVGALTKFAPFKPMRTCYVGLGSGDEAKQLRTITHMTGRTMRRWDPAEGEKGNLPGSHRLAQMLLRITCS